MNSKLKKILANILSGLIITVIFIFFILIIILGIWSIMTLAAAVSKLMFGF